MKTFSQGLFPRSWGRARGPKAQGKARPHGHVTGWGIGLDYHDIEWFALEMNRDHFVDFEIASKYCISESSVAYDGYSISSKGFLPDHLTGGPPEV